MKETTRWFESSLFWLARYAIVASAAAVFWGLTWSGLALATWSTETNLGAALWTVRVIMTIIIVIGICMAIVGWRYSRADSFSAGVVVVVVAGLLWWGLEVVLPIFALNDAQIMVISLIISGLALVGYALVATFPTNPRKRPGQRELATIVFVVNLVPGIFFLLLSFLPGLTVWISTVIRAH